MGVISSEYLPLDYYSIRSGARKQSIQFKILFQFFFRIQNETLYIEPIVHLLFTKKTKRIDGYQRAEYTCKLIEIRFNL